ncbi:hypothetical protein J6590_057420 [Homalodisca vitripennis]|nr:hypothetical protein J6590_057420 [Homalodisca vitripennis]
MPDCDEDRGYVHTLVGVRNVAEICSIEKALKYSIGLDDTVVVPHYSLTSLICPPSHLTEFLHVQECCKKYVTSFQHNHECCKKYVTSFQHNHFRFEHNAGRCGLERSKFMAEKVKCKEDMPCCPAITRILTAGTRADVQTRLTAEQGFLLILDVQGESTDS